MSWLVDTLLGDSRALSNVENPAVPLTSRRLLKWLGMDPSDTAGVSVTPASAMRFTAVYRAIALLSGVVGALPLKAYRPLAGGGAEQVGGTVVDQLHSDMTRMEIVEYLVMSLLTHGNSYDRKIRNRLGLVVELEPLQPGQVHVVTHRRWETDENRRGKRIEIHHPSGAVETLSPWDVLHVPGMSYDGIVGLSPIGMAQQGIGLALAAEKFGAGMFAKGAMIDGVLTTKRRLDQEGADRLRDGWAAKVTGPDRHWSIPVLDDETKFERIALPPAEAQYIENRKFSVQEIARLYGLPPHLLGDVERSTSWGSGIEQQNMQMLTFTLDPWLVRIESRITRELLPDGVYARFTRAGLLRADTQTRFLAYQRAVNNGWMAPDEIRELEEMGPIPDGAGQQWFRPKNLEPLDHEEAGNESTVAERVNAAGVLVRSGWLPDAALDAVGLDPIEHTGLLPVTLQKDDDNAA